MRSLYKFFSMKTFIDRSNESFDSLVYNPLVDFWSVWPAGNIDVWPKV